MYLESQRLEKEINSLQAQIKSYPQGNFFCSQNGNHYKWYHSNGSSQTYIPKNNQQLAQKLAEKKYLSLKLEGLLHEKQAIEFYLRHHLSDRPEKRLENHEEYQRLLSPFFQPKSKELSDWMYSPYEKNLKYPEQRIHKTGSGNIVRSKSEALIDMCLHTRKIPFRYECALFLNETTIYPDFTIRHPHTGDTYHWEHFGCQICKKYYYEITTIHITWNIARYPFDYYI